MPTIAGHTFVMQSDGTRKCTCGKDWRDVAPATKHDLRKVGWAHSGELTENELAQIHAECDRLWEVGKGA